MGANIELHDAGIVRGVDVMRPMPHGNAHSMRVLSSGVLFSALSKTCGAYRFVLIPIARMNNQLNDDG